MTAPRVSVVMPVRNAQEFVDEAIESILGQDFEDFEFVILDDASWDSTLVRLRYWERADSRIRLLEHHGEPLGLVRSSRYVVDRSRARVIARMDADDVAAPDRLRRQFELLSGHPDAALVGSLAEGIDGSGRLVRPVEFARLLPGRTVLPCPHPTMMFRRSAYDGIGGYLMGSDGWEDIALIARMRSAGKVFVIANPLLRYRYHANGTTIGTDQAVRADLQAASKMFLNGCGDRDGPAADDRRTNVADAFLLRAGMRLWSGYAPDMAPVFPARSTPGWLGKALRVSLYASWGKIAPRSLRMVMRARIRLDNRRLGRIEEQGVIEWGTERS